jgi:hypothetical protein
MAAEELSESDVTLIRWAFSNSDCLRPTGVGRISSDDPRGQYTHRPDRPNIDRQARGGSLPLR